MEQFQANLNVRLDPSIRSGRAFGRRSTASAKRTTDTCCITRSESLLRTWGRLFGYRGSFEVDWLAVPAGRPPDRIMPIRQERRE